MADGALIAYVSSKSFMIQWNGKGEGDQNGMITGRCSVHASFLKGWVWSVSQWKELPQGRNETGIPIM